MNTFLPYPDFAASARSLDRARLGKQRVEAFQIIRTLRGETSGWASHPAVKMWAGYTEALAFYGLTMCDEWIRRGYKDSLQSEFINALGLHRYSGIDGIPLPPWMGDADFHSSHRSALLRKDPEHYGQFGWTDSPDVPYVWPTVGQNDASQRQEARM